MKAPHVPTWESRKTEFPPWSLSGREDNKNVIELNTQHELVTAAPSADHWTLFILY